MSKVAACKYEDVHRSWQRIRRVTHRLVGIAIVTLLSHVTVAPATGEPAHSQIEASDQPDTPPLRRWIAALVPGAVALAALVVGLRRADTRARVRRDLTTAAREFFARPPQGRRWPDVVTWWDSRRLAFSLFVLFVGLIASVPWWIWGVLNGSFDALEGLMKLLVVPTIVAWSLFIMLMANAWYTGGWVVEIVLRLVLRDRWLWLGPAMLKAGVLFSTLFTVAMMYPEMALFGGQALLGLVYVWLTLAAAWVPALVDR